MSDHRPSPTILHSLRRGSAPEGVPVINVIDAIMGRGKSEYLIDRINRIRTEDQIKAFDAEGGMRSNRPSSS